MKVIRLQKHGSMMETQFVPCTGIKRIQNYVFDLGNALGTGNFSKVYKGTNQLNNQVCAIKVVEMERMKTPVLLKLLESECDVLKSLKHPNILNCLQTFTSKNNCYIVSELCNEGDLESLIQKSGPLDEARAKKIIFETFSGLKYLHEMKIIHRDFKVANVFMDSGVAKIADFGFARRLKYPDEVFKDINIGSPIYMAPECLLNHFYGPKTDVWAFGVFLFQLLHGDTPLHFCKTEADLKAHIGIPLKDHMFNPRLSPGLKNLIMRCLEIDERKRISLSEMANHPYIAQLKYQLQPKCHYLTLKASESTNSHSRVQRLDSTQGRSKITSFLNIHQEQIPTCMIPMSTGQICEPQVQLGQVVFNREISQGMSPKHILRHKNQGQTSTQFDRRLSVKSHSLDKFGTQFNNTLTSKITTPVKTEQSPPEFKKSAQKVEVIPTNSYTAEIEIKPSNIVQSDITFAQCVHILHYCRLVYKCVAASLKENCHLQSNVHLSNWLLSILKEIGGKQAQVKFDGDRASVREKKLKDVITDYQTKYVKQLRQYISTNPILDPSTIREKIKQQIRVLCLLIDAQSVKSQELIQLVYSLDFLGQATTLLITCVQRRDFGTFGSIKIQDFLSRRPQIEDVDMQAIKSRSFH